MHSENLFIDNGSNGQAIEAIRKSLPKLDIVPSFALVVETIDAVDRGAFVVPTKDKEILWIFDLVRQQEADCFQRLFSSVHIVSEEQIISLWWESTILKETKKIVVLPMYISANLLAEISLTV